MRKAVLSIAFASSVLFVGGCVQASDGGKVVRSPASLKATASFAAKDCPAPLRLPGNGIAPAANRALDEVKRLYDGIDTTNARATQAARGPAAGVRGRQIKKECGLKVQRRSVVVELFFPKMRESASLSQGTVFVSRFRRSYKVWERAH